MRLNIKKRKLFLFFGFTSLFILFALFQNFEFLTDTEEALRAVPISSVVKKMGKIEFFRPYFFREHLGNLETPFGYNTSIQRHEGPIIFDDKKFLDDKWRASPLYNQTKGLFEMSRSPSSQSTPDCVQDPRATTNNCLANYNSDDNKSSGGGMKFRANPLRRMASVSYGGEIDSQLMYDEGQKSVNLEFSKKINSNSNLNLEMKSQDQSGQINIDWRW